MSARGPLLARFLAKVYVPSDSPTACWTWTGAMARGGYGEIFEGGHRGRMRRAHRVAWELANGPIPTGMAVRHRCDNPLCVRPSHLEMGTQADNVRDRTVRRRGRRSRAGLPYGVSRHGRGWEAQVWAAGRLRHLGTFPTIEHAAEAAERERVRLHGPAPQEEQHGL